MGSLSSPNPGGSGGSGGFGPSQLAGPSASQAPGPGGSDSPDTPGSSPDSQANALQATVEQVRTIEQGMLSLAQQFPQAAPEVRRAVDAIRAVLQRIVSSPSQQEPPAPQSLA